MAEENHFQPRPGRVRSSRAQRTKPFIAQVLSAAQKAGGRISRDGSIGGRRGSRFGRGRVAAVQANRLLTSRSRGAVVKGRFLRHATQHGKLAAHLGYFAARASPATGRRRGYSGPESDNADPESFAERCEDDRHHFRFIVSPDDAVEMADLKGFTRDLMAQVEKDLGTKLDWVAVDHWNTEHPHVHIIIRGRTDDGQDLVIDRDYIKQGNARPCSGPDHPGAGAAHRSGDSPHAGAADRQRTLDQPRPTAFTRRLSYTASSTWRPTPIASPTNFTH